MSDDFDRLPPHNLQAEQRTLGGMLLSKDAITDVVEVLQARDYYRPAHQLIHEVAVDLYGRGEPADAVTVVAELARRTELGRVGDPTYLHTLIASVPTAANAGYYALIVREQAQLRRLIEAGTRIVQFGYAGDGDPDGLYSRAREEIDEAAAAAVRSGDGTDLGSLIWPVLDSLERKPGEIPGLRTGLVDLDSCLNLIRAKQFGIIAARPAAGKSALALNIAANVAIRQRKRVDFWSLEMSREELMLRLLSAEARVPLHSLVGRNLSAAELERLAKTAAEIVDAPLHIFDRATAGLLDIRAELRTATAAKDPSSMVIVDYLQLMDPPKRAENRQQEVSGLSRGLKLLAKEHDIAVLALAQLNRGPEHRTDKRPVLADLRESGSLEQDADFVLLLHRDDMYEKESPRAGEIDLIIGKQRNGPQTTVTCAFQGWFSRVVDMARI